MNREEIDYKDIMNLGFTEETQNDIVYRNKYGFDWCIINKKLKKDLYFDWEKETRLCKLVRWDPNNGDILGELPIMNLDQLKILNQFFCKNDLRISNFKDKENKNGYNFSQWPLAC